MKKPISIFSISISVFILFFFFKLLDFFLNGTAWFWEYAVFIPEYFFTLAALGMLALCVREKDTRTTGISFLFLIATLINLPIVIADDPVRANGNTITVLSYNKGFWQPMDESFAEFLKSQNADIILIQESVPEDDVDFILQKLPGWYGVRAHDVVTLSRYPIVDVNAGRIGRHVKTTHSINGKEIDVYNTHTRLVLVGLGAGGPIDVFRLRNEEFIELYEQLDSGDRCKIIGGDFNTKSNSRPIGYLMKNFNDAARATTSYPITWNSVIPLFRVDYIFSSPLLKPISYQSFTHIPSDHYVIKTTLAGIERC